MRIGTIYQNEVCDAYIQNVQCPHCNSTVDAALCRSVQKGTILFIPFIKMTVSYYSICQHCGIRYIFNKKKYDQIRNSTSKQYDWNRLCRDIFEKTTIKSDQGIMRSSKKVAFAAALSLFFGLFGLQNLYMGHVKRFMMNLLLIAFSVIMFAAGLISKGFVSTGFISGLIWLCAFMLAVNLYWGLIDFVRILSGHAKDVNGAYLLTNRQYKKRLSANAELHKYEAMLDVMDAEQNGVHKKTADLP